MKIHEFYREFDKLPKEKRYGLIIPTGEPTSLFVVFQQLGQVRAQKKYFEDREAFLLKVAEMGFNQVNNVNNI